MKLGEDLDAYFAAKARVHEGFAYTPDWVEIPLDDAREYYWMLVGGEGVGATCVYSDKPFTDKSIVAEHLQRLGLHAAVSQEVGLPHQNARDGRRRHAHRRQQISHGLQCGARVHRRSDEEGVVGALGRARLQ